MSGQKEKNLDLLEKRFPGMKKLIEERAEKLIEEEQLLVEEEIAFTGERILKVHKDGRTLYLGGKREPRLPAETQVKLLGKLAYSAPIFFVGMGNIFYIEELLKVVREDTMILWYEPSFSIFYKQLEQLDLTPYFKKGVMVFVIGGINDEPDTIGALSASMLEGDKIPVMKNIILPNYEELCGEKVYDFEKCLIEQARHYQSEKNTEHFFSQVWADNVLHNAKYVRTNYKASQLAQVLPLDIPAIVVAAGPSLNRNIKELKKAKNHAFIIAVDTALKPLLNEGIVPDMYATLDGKKPLELIQVEGTQEIPLLTHVNSSKQLLDYHKGKKFFVRQEYDYINEIYDMNHKSFEPLVSGGSVATLAFSLACHVGFECVILVGQDLAYTNNKSHADGTFANKIEKTDTSKYLMVPGNYEEKVPTLHNLNEYRRWFEEFIDYWKKNNELRVINATEGGAKIEGTELMTLKEAIEQECNRKVNIAECIDKLKPVFDEEEQEKILEYFHDTPHQFAQIGVLAQDGLRLYGKLNRMCTNRNFNKDAYLKLLRRIKKNTKKIEKNPCYQMIEISLAEANHILLAGQYEEYQSFEEEGKSIAKKGKLYMQLVKECAELMQHLAEETVVKVK